MTVPLAADTMCRSECRALESNVCDILLDVETGSCPLTGVKRLACVLESSASTSFEFAHQAQASVLDGLQQHALHGKETLPIRWCWATLLAAFACLVLPKQASQTSLAQRQQALKRLQPILTGFKQPAAAMAAELQTEAMRSVQSCVHKLAPRIQVRSFCSVLQQLSADIGQRRGDVRSLTRQQS